MKYFTLKQANKANLSSPIKILHDNLSGRGLRSSAEVAGHPAREDSGRARRGEKAGFVYLSQGFGHELTMCPRKEVCIGYEATGQTEGRVQVTPRQTSPLGA